MYKIKSTILVLLYLFSPFNKSAISAILFFMAKTFDDKKIIYTMDRVSRAYGTKVVLKDISISYYYGAKIGVIGENGAGKSSLFKIFAGIDRDYTGETKLLPG